MPGLKQHLSATAINELEDLPCITVLGANDCTLVVRCAEAEVESRVADEDATLAPLCILHNPLLPPTFVGVVLDFSVVKNAKVSSMGIQKANLRTK